MKQYLFVMSIFLILGYPLICEADTSLKMAIYYSGLKKGNNCNEFIQNEKELYSTVFDLMNSGDKRTKRFINKVYTSTLGKKYQKMKIHFFSDTIVPTIQRVKGDSSSTSNNFDSNTVYLSFISLDNTIVLDETISSGMKKVAVYTLASFFLLSYEKRRVIFSKQFVVPLEGATDSSVNSYTYANALVGKKSLKDLFVKLQTQMIKKALVDKKFKNILENEYRLVTMESQKLYGIVDINNVRLTNIKKDSYKINLKREYHFRQLASYMATVRFCREIAMSPPFMEVDPVKGVHKVVHQTKTQKNSMKNQREQIINVINDICDKDGLKLTGNMETFYKKNPFPQPNLILEFDIILNQTRVSENYYSRKDNIQSKSTLTLKNIYDHVVTPKSNRPFQFVHEITHKFTKGDKGDKVEMSDAYFYNAMLLSMKKNKEILFDTTKKGKQLKSKYYESVFKYSIR